VPRLKISDPEVHAAAVETGDAREAAGQADKSRGIGRVMGLANRISSRPVLDARSPDEILGYDGHGLPG